MSFSPATVAARLSERALDGRRQRYRDEVDRLIRAAFRVMQRRGVAGATVGEILRQAGLSTRAFYRHFASRDELLLALYEHQTESANERLAPARDASRSPTARLEAWIDEMLALAFEKDRAPRTALLRSEADRISRERPEVIERIVGRHLAILEDVLRAGRVDGSLPDADPAADARLIHGAVWAASDPRYGPPPLRSAARRAILRFVASAVGARPPARRRAGR